MKKFISLFCFSLGLYFSQAQSHMLIHLNNGTISEFLLSEVDSVTYGTPPFAYPTIETLPIYYIFNDSALCSGVIIDTGASAIIQSGICWSLTNPPTISDFVKLNQNLNITSFGLWMNNLQQNSTYYARAFATNSFGTSYGQVESFIANGVSFLGDMSGQLEMQILNFDSTFSNVPTITLVQQTSPITMNVAFEWSELFGGGLGTTVPYVSGILNGTTLTITNQSWDFLGSSVTTIVFDGTIEFDATFDNILNTSSLTISGSAIGSYTLNGVKQ